MLAISADGSRIATTYILGDGPRPVRVSLRRTDSLLLETCSRRSVAGVRCDASTCERATRTVRHDLQFRTGFRLAAGG